jgi:hypothetical protein
MKVNKSSLFWGILLIGFGAYALAQTMGYEVSQEPTFWAFVFGGISLLSLVFYLSDGFRAWGWLFPVGIFGALAFLLTMVANDVDKPAMVAPLFVGIGLPFVVAYFIDRTRNWWALIPSGVMLFLTFVMLMVDNVNGEWIGALFLFMIALSFFIVYLNNRVRNWWALIPAGVMLFLALIVVLSTATSGEWIGALFLFAIALSFFVVYLNNRTRNWALLVAYIMFVLSLAPAMASFGGDTAGYFGSVFLFAIALPFFVIYFRSAENWWAIIPAGVMTTLSIIATLGIAGWIKDDQTGGYSNAILMGGLAVTFAVVWLRNAKAWAKVVTVVLAALAIGSIFFVSYCEMFWPVAIILVGGYLLYTAMRPKTV